MDSAALITRAVDAIHIHTTPDGRLFGDVGAALITSTGAVHTGVCVDTPGWGLCAERSAMAAMITGREYVIDRIVAVWRNPETHKVHILPPCGICREFMRAVDLRNLDAQVILGPEHAQPLRDLLPAHAWPEPM